MVVSMVICSTKLEWEGLEIVVYCSLDFRSCVIVLVVNDHISTP